jgi:2-hydroxychromene-2-carboxylate isomerase
LRNELAGRLDAARTSTAAFTRSLRRGAEGRLERIGSLDKSLDALANAVRHAGSGYAGLFDAAKVREEQLEALYRFDLDLVDDVDTVREAAAALGADDGTLLRLEQAVAKVRKEFARREEVVRGVFSRPNAPGGGR